MNLHVKGRVNIQAIRQDGSIESFRCRDKGPKPKQYPRACHGSAITAAECWRCYQWPKTAEGFFTFYNPLQGIKKNENRNLQRDRKTR